MFQAAPLPLRYALRRNSAEDKYRHGRRLSTLRFAIFAPVLYLQTGLTGAFDFKRTGRPRHTAAAPADPLPGPTIFEAVESQLGLKLESKKLPLPMIVIDRVDRVPTGN